MKKTNHSEEIRATRVGGFGGSDAAMVLAMAERIREGQPQYQPQQQPQYQQQQRGQQFPPMFEETDNTPLPF